jgi:hypothetical protein
MSNDPYVTVTDPEDEPDPNAELFALRNEHWEALQRGASIDLEDWARTHPEEKDKLPHLRLVSRLYDALQAVREDSSEGPSTQSPRAAADSPARDFLEPGTTIDEFRIESLLGHGGMGEVYLAEHTVMGNKVAVKVLPAGRSGDGDALRRFLQEVRVQARMSPHPNVAAAFHAGEYQGRYYLVMEYIPGVNLEEYVRRHGPLPWEQACALIRHVAAGLDYVHGHDIVHRDLKPSNLRLTPGGLVKILDLGLARHRPADVLNTDASLTPDRAVLGTLDYMAPEQAQSARKADARSDLYSLGCTFYYLLTGKAPFADRVGLDKLTAHTRDAPPPVREQRPDVPEAVASVVHRLLAKKPEERYPSARVLIDVLDEERHGGEKPRLQIGAAMTGLAGHGESTTKANRSGRRVLLAGGAGVLIAAAVASAWFWIVHRDTGRVERSATALQLLAPNLKDLDIAVVPEERRRKLVVGGVDQILEPLPPLTDRDRFMLSGTFNRPVYWYMLWFDTEARFEVDDWSRSPERQIDLRYPSRRTGVKAVNPQDAKGIHLLMLVASDSTPAEGKPELERALGGIGRPPQTLPRLWGLRGGVLAANVGEEVSFDYLDRVQRGLPPSFHPVYSIWLQTK